MSRSLLTYVAPEWYRAECADVFLLNLVAPKYVLDGDWYPLTIRTDTPLKLAGTSGTVKFQDGLCAYPLSLEVPHEPIFQAG